MKKHSPKFLLLVNDAKKCIVETDVVTVHQRMKNNETFILVDVREESEWQQAHLPDALYLGKGIIERDVESSIPDMATEIILYCGGGFRSALVADTLQKMGYKNVVSMDGGYTGWKEAGYPVVVT